MTTSFDTAVADYHSRLAEAAVRYSGFSHIFEQKSDARAVLRAMSVERAEDADHLATAVNENGTGASPLAHVEAPGDTSEIDDRPLRRSKHAALVEVSRSENLLVRVGAQLASIADDSSVRAVLMRIGRRIMERKPQIRSLVSRWTPRGAAWGDSLSQSGREVDGVEQEIWFGTNRNLHGSNRFGSVRSPVTSFGNCRVFVPMNRTIGTTGSSWVDRLLRGDNRIKVRGTTVSTEAEFWLELKRVTAAIPISDRHALVYIHGYKNGFLDAARQTAQLKTDLDHKGPAAFFSWPSLGVLNGYSGDVAANEASEGPLREFLCKLAKDTGVEAVHIIAHSMGNRALLRAVDAIARDASTSTVRFGCVILAAADVDATLFQQLAPAYAKISQRATLYVSTNDKAIGLSGAMHRYPRAGILPPVTVVPGIDTIDTSEVNLNLIGHGYVTEIRAVLTDIYELLKRGTPPVQRFGLRQINHQKGTYWQLKA